MKVIKVLVILLVMGVSVEGLDTIFKVDMLPKAEAKDRTVTNLGAFDIVTGSDGYQGTGRQVGRFYLYNDNE